MALPALQQRQALAAAKAAGQVAAEEALKKSLAAPEAKGPRVALVIFRSLIMMVEYYGIDYMCNMTFLCVLIM